MGAKFVIANIVFISEMCDPDTIEAAAGDPEYCNQCLSGHALWRYSSDDRKECVSDYHDYGFSARLTKPYKLEKLREILSNLIGCCRIA
jgi:hypothetical protein